MAKWKVKRVNCNLAALESEKLQAYCQRTGRTATDVVRELIRYLPTENEPVQLSKYFSRYR